MIPLASGVFLARNARWTDVSVFQRCNAGAGAGGPSISSIVPLDGLATSPPATIFDLRIICPNSAAPWDMPALNPNRLRLRSRLVRDASWIGERKAHEFPVTLGKSLN